MVNTPTDRFAHNLADQLRDNLAGNLAIGCVAAYSFGDDAFGVHSDVWTSESQKRVRSSSMQRKNIHDAHARS